jgi:hypothetical protein
MPGHNNLSAEAMPDTTLIIRPSVSFAQPEPLVVFAGEPARVHIVVKARAAGPGKLKLRVEAETCFFVEGTEMRSSVEQAFECKDEWAGQVETFAFQMMTTQPSSEDILLRFYASASNSSGGLSAETPAFRVNLKSKRLSTDTVRIEIPA